MRMFIYGAVVVVVSFAVSMVVMSGQGPLASPDATPLAEPAAPMDHDMADMAEMAMASGADHDHPMREVTAGLPVPTVTHLVFPDAMDGYNVQILTENFTFAPASINQEPVENEGHAHLYINGVKISRVYGNWVHIPSSALVSGANAVSITLNANDHSAWAVEGVEIGSTVIVHKHDLVALSDG